MAKKSHLARRVVAAAPRKNRLFIKVLVIARLDRAIQ
jgi:hypothetical protein